MKANIIKNNRVICHIKVADLNSKIILELSRLGYIVEFQEQAL